ncbi:clusterin-associated protein 1 isoform X1 [Maniola jurtina]|uniref:clusterin-associated protein 1 isoform X1 n=1 Tax=Maniola jurtina TaxID=191418 RepID=UPI001E687504|nr:clusterin-associated protein 1 isoform X1 [Maniola jurtina]
MSYRDLRNFSEAMRALGFPQQISLESFRNPNWELVETCLRWLAARIEPDAVLAGGKDTVEQRVAMVTHATELFHSRANLKLNGKKIYGADGWAVRELLKVASLLRSALETPSQDDQLADSNPLVYDVSNRVSEIKQARALATDITAQGAFLYDLLAKEPENKEHRDKALSRPLDMSSLESALSRAVETLSARVSAVREQIDNVASSEAALDAKLERRRAELQRAEKRLHTVQKIKPAYQSELNSLESEIEELWEQYVLRYRCVEALKHQLSLLETAQAEAAEEQQAAIMQLIHKYEAEDVLGKLSDSDEANSSEEEKESVKQPRPATRPKTRLRIKTAGAGPDARRAFGAMQARDDSRDLDDSSDTDLSDTQLYGGGDGGGRWSRPRPATRTLAAADDYADLMHAAKAEGEEGSEGSLGSSSESELRLTSAHPGRTSALSDNEF